MTTISSVEAQTVRIPLPEPVAFSTRLVQARFYTIVRIERTDGIVGCGFCHGGSRSGALPTKAVHELFAPLLLGQDPFRTEGLWHELHQDALLNGRAGAVMRALSAIDIALWDGNARSVGLPLWRYLGAFRRETVPAYFSGGYYRTGNVDEVVQEVQQAVASGFTAMKLKIGKGSPAADAARVAAAREIIGQDGLLLLDANNAWTDLASALRAVKPLLQFDPFLIEEPFPPEDYQNHRRLARAVPVPIASGELAAGRSAHRALIEQGDITVLQPDAAVCGGITEWKRIAATAASASVPVMPHSFHDLHVHLVASIPNGLMVEYFHDASVLPFRGLIDRQLEVRNGELVLPQDPGLGFSFLPSELERYSC
jgi:L-alanine-DL-glutamate epimerase-like enolase superfamily enzyme